MCRRQTAARVSVPARWPVRLRGASRLRGSARKRWAGVAMVAALVGLCAAPANAFIYWGTRSSTIGRASLDSSGATQTFITGTLTPENIALDPAHVFWASSDGNTIGRANLDGSAVDQAFITNANSPDGVAVDAAHIYWGSYGNNSVGRANIDGTGITQTFITGTSGTTGVAVDGAHIYWASSNGNAIGRANLDGSGVDQNFITGANSPGGVALDGTHIYWANFGANTIGRANLDGSGVNQNFITGASSPDAVALDGTFIYWSNFGANTIGRANVDGSGANQSFIAANSPTGVAVDRYLSTPPPPPAVPDAPGAPTLLSPRIGDRVRVAPLTGRVRVKRPGSARFSTLGDGQAIPVGSTVDTTKGKARLSSAVDVAGSTQTSDFYDGVFVVGQARGQKLTEIRLGGGKARACRRGRARGRRAALARRKPRHRSVRKLWGSGRGAFRTRGHYAAATVRGTRWLVQDFCDGTMIRAASGTVAVTDFVRHRSVTVRAGHSYFVRARR